MDVHWLTQAYRDMCLIRAFEKRLNELFLEGVVAGTTHLCIGQEACAVGVCAALTADDVIFSNHRGHGHLLARGGDPARLMAEIFGRATGYSGGRGGSQHVAVRTLNFLGTHGITAGTIPLAVGAALHLKRAGTAAVAVVFFGDGAVGEGAFHEALNIAALRHLPVLFVCENNGYAMSSPHRRFSPVARVADRAAAYGMDAAVVDGNDADAVRHATATARRDALSRPAPHLIELQTYRLCGHSRGDPCIYRTREEEGEWHTRDPLVRARQTLQEYNVWDETAEETLAAEVSKRIARAEAFARHSGEDGHA